MADTPGLKLAVFGRMGAGKTVFFSSYYGSQHSDAFEATHGYRLIDQQKTQGTTLLGRYSRIKSGRFPEATDSLSTFKFDLMVGSLPTPGMTVSWLDYPGEWWDKIPESPTERQERNRALSELITSDAIVLFLDGVQLKAQGPLYFRPALFQFSLVISSLKKEIKQSGKSLETLPTTVILAVAKADTLPIDTTAKQIADEILSEANREINLVAVELGTEKKPAPFLSHVVLLSSVYAPNPESIDPDRTMSLDLIAPLAFAAILDDAAQRAGKKHWAGFLGALLNGLSTLVHWIDTLDDFLPKRFQFITAILKIMPLESLAKNGAAELQKVHTEAVNRSDSITATVAAIFLTLEKARGSRSYYHVSG